jgi:hypothetical protein
MRVRRRRFGKEIRWGFMIGLVLTAMGLCESLASAAAADEPTAPNAPVAAADAPRRMKVP